MRLALAAFALGVTAHASAQRAPGYSVEVPERVQLIAGTGGTLPIAVTVERGRSVSKDANVIIDLAPDSAITIKRRRLGRADAVDPDADAPRFAINLRGDTAGDFVIRVRIRFWLCGAKVCRPVEVRRNVAIAVAIPSPV